MGLLHTLRRILRDVFVRRRHLENYAIVAISIPLIVIGILNDDVPTHIQLAVIMAALSVLVFRQTVPREEDVDLDTVLHDRRSYGQFADFIKHRRTLWIYGPSAINVMRNVNDIQHEILERGGQVRIIVQNPYEAASIATLRQQLEEAQDLSYDIQGSLKTMRRLIRSGNFNFDYRLLAFSPGFSIVIVDPDRREGRLTLEMIGFRNNSTNERMHIEITRRSSPYWFEYWVDQYRMMWDSAQPEPTSVQMGE